MAHFPPNATGLAYVTYPVGPTAQPGTAITASGSANTKGSYAEFVASTANATNYLDWKISFSSTTNGSFLVDIATGAAASEVVLIPNILAEGIATSSARANGLYGPWLVDIASSTRVALRCQASTGSMAVGVSSLGLWNAGDTDGATGYAAYGVSTATSEGTTIDAGGSANTKGSYAELTASSGAVTQQLTLITSIRNTGAVSTRWAIDIATGAAASEVVLIPDVRRSIGASLNHLYPRSNTWLTYIANSTRIAARASCGTSDATDRLIRVGLIGATGTADAHYPQSTAGLNYITYPAGPAAAGTALDGSGVANTKGAYTEFVPSTSFASSYAELVQLVSDNSSLQILIDIATGAAAAEAVVVPNLLHEATDTGSAHTGGRHSLPLAIASSTRVALRFQWPSTGTTDEPEVALTLIGAGSTSTPTSYTTYGADTTDSGGTQVDPGGSANTKGSYSQLTASTSGVIQALVFSTTVKGNTAYGGNFTWAMDLATGAAASEVVLIPDLRATMQSVTQNLSERSRTYVTYIASATRLAVRASCSATDATDRLIDVSITGAAAPVGGGGGGSGGGGGKGKGNKGGLGGKKQFGPSLVVFHDAVNSYGAS